ncbi:MAG: GNAT family N-acetyltransferase [Siculibacillus sp.]|nr:GNAT family N-acetyltransferase [Siculibacillus sp.]
MTDRSDPLIRPATPTDLAAIRTIYADAVINGCASFEIEPPDVAEMAARMAKIREAGLPWFVAEVDGRVLGYAYAGPYRPRPAYRFTVENSVYVAPDAKGRGLGRALLAALIEATTALGLRQMLAVIGDSANTASIGLHAALGFTHAGLLTSVGWKHGRWLDSVLMRRPLGPGDETPPTTRPMP